MRVAMKHTRPHDAYIKMLNDITFSLVFQATSGTFRSNDMMATFRECNKKKKKGLITKTKPFHVHHTFCTFLCRFCMTAA